MLPGIIFFVIPRILNSRFAGVGKPQLLLWVFVPALLVNAALNFWLVPLYGGIGAAWASNVSYIGGAISLIVLFSVKMNFPLNEILIFRSSDFAVFTKYLPKRS
jgi:O-antigen/teichoic acid export membrane protein